MLFHIGQGISQEAARNDADVSAIGFAQIADLLAQENGVWANSVSNRRYESGGGVVEKFDPRRLMNRTACPVSQESGEYVLEGANSHRSEEHTSELQSPCN